MQPSSIDGLRKREKEKHKILLTSQATVNVRVSHGREAAR